MATPIPQNSAAFSTSEIAEATGGALSGEDRRVAGVVTDSRAVREGSLFVALRGERFDGHRFAGQAAESGAGALLIARDGEVAQSEGVPRIAVEDTTHALGDLASHHRVRWGGPVVAITGSAGKTSTKELVAAALEGEGTRVLKTHGNLNNLVGVPMMLFLVDDGTDVAVIEMGTNAPGEIARLGAIGRPDVALITLVAAAHTEGIGTIEDVAREKTSLLAALGPDGVAVLNADDAYLSKAPLDGRRGVYFGRAEGADVRVVDVAVDAALKTRVGFDVKGLGEVRAELQLLGEAAAQNAAAALAVVVARGGDVRAAAKRLEAVAPTPGRLCPTPGGPFAVIDDSYNANPSSTRMSLGIARALADARGTRLVAVLADMLELGAESASAHAAAGAQAHAHANGGAVFVGPEMKQAYEAARTAGDAERFVHVDDAGDAAAHVRRLAEAGDVILVKGSRSMKTERAVAALTEGEGAA